MATPDLPDSQSTGSDGGDDALKKPVRDRSRLEETLVKSPLWKKQTLRDIEYAQEVSSGDSGFFDASTARLIHKLTTQLDECNQEIDRMRASIAHLESDRSAADEAHQRQLEELQTALTQLRDAYDQFEQESDTLINELDQQNQRLLDECRSRNPRSLLE